MPSERLTSRLLATTLIAAMALAGPAGAQSRRAPSPDAGALSAPLGGLDADAAAGGLRPGTAPLASPLAPTPGGLSPSVPPNAAATGFGGPGAAPRPGGATAAATATPAGTLVANYGKPRPKTRLPKRYPPLRVASPPPFSPGTPLPALQPYRSSAQARLKLRLRPSAPGAEPPPLPPPGPTIAVMPFPKQKPRPKPDDRPYDPIGIGVGSLRLLPSLEASYGYDDNPNRLAQPNYANGGSTTQQPIKGSQLLRSDGALAVRSDWDRHEFTADLRLGYSEYFNFQEASRPDGRGAMKARYDVTRDTALDFLGRFNLDTQRPGSPNITSGGPGVTVVNRPIVLSFGNSAGVTQTFNHLKLALRGGYDRNDYQDAQYSDGTSLRLSSSNYTGYYGTGRVDYELGPIFTPFVEATLEKRVHDDTLDLYGYARDSNGLALRGGAKAKISELLRAEASGGYAERRFDDLRLPRLRGPTIDADILYTPTPLTTVSLRASTTLNETTVAGAAGTLSRVVSAKISHDLLRNLTISATGSYSMNDYQGADIKERGYTAGVQLEYKITRAIAIKGSYSHEHLHSTSQGADYTANVFLVGLKLQR